MLDLYALSPVFFQVSFVVLALKEGTSLGTLEIVTLAVGIPYSLLWCILGWCTVGTLTYTRVFLFHSFSIYCQTLFRVHSGSVKITESWSISQDWVGTFD